MRLMAELLHIGIGEISGFIAQEFAALSKRKHEGSRDVNLSRSREF